MIQEHSTYKLARLTTQSNFDPAMNCYIFDVHINCCLTYENSEYNLVEFGPLSMISSQTLSRISAILQSISTDDVPKSWWTEFSTWRDFKALLRTGSVLSIHKVVKYMTENFENIHGFDVAIDTIDENGNIEITITEDTEDIFQGFTVKAKRKRLRRLQDIAAFNLAQHLVSEVEVESLNIPQTLIPIVKRFLVTYSGSYIIDMKTN